MQTSVKKGIIVAIEYWNCDCEDSYVHHISEKTCKHCLAAAEHSPKSTLEEVLDFFVDNKKIIKPYSKSATA